MTRTVENTLMRMGLSAILLFSLAGCSAGTRSIHGVPSAFNVQRERVEEHPLDLREGELLTVALRHGSIDVQTSPQGEPRLSSTLSVHALDEKQAEQKLADVVAGRLAIARAMATSRNRKEFSRKMEAIAPAFEYVRFWSIESERENRDG